MVEETRKQLVTNIAHDLVAQIAPQELPLFSLTSDAYFKNPDKLLKGQKGKDEILGLGPIDNAVNLMAPIILVVADAAIKVLVGEVIPEKIKESGIIGKMFSIIGKMFKKKRPKEKDKQVTLPSSLTPEQLEEVRNVAFSIARRRFNLSKSQAELLADALVGCLTLAHK